jgi:hypothetical protein
MSEMSDHCDVQGLLNLFEGFDQGTFYRATSVPITSIIGAVGGRVAFCSL